MHLKIIENMVHDQGFLHEYYLSDFQHLMLEKPMYIFMVLGAPLYGILLKYLSCKTLLLLTYIIHVIGFSSYLVPNWPLAIGAAGIASVGSIIVTPLYIYDCVEPAYHAFIGALCSTSINLGVAVIYFLGPSIDLVTLNYVCWSCAVVFVCGYMWLPDSPIWLISHDRISEAEDSLNKLRREGDVDAQMQVLLKENEMNTALLETGRIGSVLKDKGMKKALILVLGVMLVQQCTGVHSQFVLTLFTSAENLTVMHLTQIFGSLTGALLLHFFGRKTILIAVMILIIAACKLVYLAQLCGIVIGVSILNFFGRKTLFVATIAMVVAVWVLANSSCASCHAFYSNMLYVMFYSMAMGTVPFVMLPELLPAAARGITVTVAGVLTGILTLLYAFIAFKSLYIYELMIFTHGLLNISVILFIVFGLFETKDKTPSEIYNLLCGNNNTMKRNGEELTIMRIMSLHWTNISVV